MGLHSADLLQQDEPAAVEIIRADGESPFLLVCEHASNRVPVSLKGLGLPLETIASHAAWDPGALPVSNLLSQILDATLIFQNYSRLVYDCNRPPNSPTAMAVKSEIHQIVGNEELSASDRLERTKAIYRPFHQAISEVIDRRAALGQETKLVTIHSFTPVYFGKKRSVELGILHDADERLANQLLEASMAHPHYVTARNQPYGPSDGVTHTLQMHGICNGIENVMIEVRNDLIADENGQKEFAEYFARLLSSTIK